MASTEYNYLSIPARRDLMNKLERIELSADAKIVLGKLMDTTVDVGGKVLEVGRQILGFVFDLVKRFRGITFGVCMGLTVSFLIASTPVIGGLLAALMTPILVAFGLTMGALEDVRNGALRDDIAQFGQSVEASAARA